MKKDSTQDISDWFLRKADPFHAPMTFNGTRFEYINGKWKSTVVDPNWHEYWEKRNRRVLDKFLKESCGHYEHI